MSWECEQSVNKPNDEPSERRNAAGHFRQNKKIRRLADEAGVMIVR